MVWYRFIDCLVTAAPRKNHRKYDQKQDQQTRNQRSDEPGGLERPFTTSRKSGRNTTVSMVARSRLEKKGLENYIEEVAHDKKAHDKEYGRKPDPVRPLKETPITLPYAGWLTGRP